MIYWLMNWPICYERVIMPVNCKTGLRPTTLLGEFVNLERLGWLGPWEINRLGPISPWWRHQMETFSVLLAICAGNSPGTGEFPAQRPVTRRLDVFFDLRPNKRLSKQWWGWWLRRHGAHYDVSVMQMVSGTHFTKNSELTMPWAHN